MSLNAKHLSTILSGALLLALTGCGSDPVTECITGDQALAALRTVFPGIEPCGTDANGNSMVSACGPGGVVTAEPYTKTACAFKGPSSCGNPTSANTTCNVLGRFTVDIYTKEGCTSKCFTPGNIHVENLHMSCQDENNPNPQPCEADPSNSN